MKRGFTLSFLAVSTTLLMACQSTSDALAKRALVDKPDLVGTSQPFASEAIYFLMTDRFVDGDPNNNYEEQGGDYPTWEGKLEGPNGQVAYVGYMGGDFQGVLNNADYFVDLGFSALWMTPIVDNPDQAFAGGEPIEFGGMFKDGNKTGYHGYWASNFYKEDEHLVSPGLDYATLNHALAEKGLKTILDVVANHGSPSFTMAIDQPKFGELYDIEGNLVADHQNLDPTKLSQDEPLHDFFHDYPDILQLSNLDDTNPAVQDYLINSYLHWIDKGAAAFRIDTIKHVPHRFWRIMADRIREKHPDFYIFSESYDYNANFIAQHTLPKNGGISVLDFPGQAAMTKVFENPESDFAELEGYLHLTHGPYHNVYELTTFYDNHDMRRLNADDMGFVNAHNWLFTTRGIPVVYQGSEFGFMRGTSEHMGNRNYIGQERLDAGKQHVIYRELKNIANVRKTLPALQRGLQINLELSGQTASFYRVIDTADSQQIALVLLNKGDAPADFEVSDKLQAGLWMEQLSGVKQNVTEVLKTQVKPHGVQVWVLNEGVTDPDLLRASIDAVKYR
ncbi:MAG: cyclomaltodextrin glucanotransferase [Alteromonadaceae bacterium]|nr:cyclomaltodextrin glucanotransferase [Alteromonadaceae bacterium]